MLKKPRHHKAKSAVLSNFRPKTKRDASTPNPGFAPEQKAVSSKEAAVSHNPYIRQHWINTALAKKVDEYTDTTALKVFIGSWNVNGKKPKGLDLTQWLEGTDADIYAIGFQEIVDLNAPNLVMDHNATKAWETAIGRALKKGYVMVCTRHLVGVSLIVHVKLSVFPHLSDVQSDTVGVGIMGVGGNKAAVVCRFLIHDTSLCFVNSHFAARKSNVKGRNENFKSIMRRVSFWDASTNAQINIASHDSVFWFGDLNYRLNMADLDSVYTRIRESNWPNLLGHDQLILEKAAGNTLVGFQEGHIDFAPTYKFQPGTTEYETRPDKKVRFPAWCDRVLWKGKGVDQLLYQSVPLKLSDHLPVRSLFSTAVRKVDDTKKKAVYQGLCHMLDRWENETYPKVELESSVVRFPDVSFDTPMTRSLTINNTGQVVAEFRFVPKMQDSVFCKPWLALDKQFGIILPGDSVTVDLTVHISKRHAFAFILGEELLEDILIFRLENGRDYFITVTGNYTRSCFGASVQYLVNTPAPIRYSELSPVPVVLSIPKELWRMVDYIYKCGLQEEGLFSRTGDRREIKQIAESLDCGTPFPSNLSVHSMCEAVTSFLDNLAAPVFKPSLLDGYVESSDPTVFCRSVLRSLSPSHFNTFCYLLAFLQTVMRHTEDNKINDVSLVVLFSSSLMHLPVAGTEGVDRRNKAWAVLRWFLTTTDFLAVTS